MSLLINPPNTSYKTCLPPLSQGAQTLAKEKSKLDLTNLPLTTKQLSIDIGNKTSTSKYPNELKYLHTHLLRA